MGKTGRIFEIQISSLTWLKRQIIQLVKVVKTYARHACNLCLFNQPIPEIKCFTNKSIAADVASCGFHYIVQSESIGAKLHIDRFLLVRCENARKRWRANVGSHVTVFKFQFTLELTIFL